MCQSMIGSHKCSNCGSGNHRYDRLEDKTECPAHGKICNTCNRRNPLTIMSKSKTKKIDNDEGEEELTSLLQIFTAPEICSSTGKGKGGGTLAT